MRRFALFAALMAVPLALAPAGGARAGTTKFSPAQIALFESPHLANITTLETIDYHYTHVGPRAFAGTVSEAVTRIGRAGARDVQVDFLPGNRYAFRRPFQGFRGNPLLMVFLQHDVVLMHREFGFAPDYFRNKIRDSLLLGASLTAVTVIAAGHAVPAQRITLRPFAGDPRFANFPAVTGKVYRFVLSDKVPGTLVSLSAVTPADPQSGAPRLEDRMIYVGVHP